MQSLKALMPQLMIATDFEAQNLGMFLNAIYQLVKKWDVSLFRADCFPPLCPHFCDLIYPPQADAWLSQTKLVAV